MRTRRTIPLNNSVGGGNQPFAAAPLALITRLHTVRKSPANCVVTRCVLTVREKRLRRSRYIILPNAGLPLARSRKSLSRICFRTQPHIFSTGLRSGDFGGKAISLTFGRSYDFMDLLVRRKDSLSKRTFQGPLRLRGLIARKAVDKLPLRTAADHSCSSVLRASCHRTGAKPPEDTPPHKGTIRGGGTCLMYLSKPANSGRLCSDGFRQVLLMSDLQ